MRWRPWREINMRSAVVHFEIAGKDAAQLRRFYSLLFQWRMDPGASDKYTEVHTEAGAGIDGGIFETPGDIPASVTLYVAVDDVDAVLARVAILGGQVLMPAMAIPGVGTIAILGDPSGNPIGLLQNQPSLQKEDTRVGAHSAVA